MVGGVQRSLAAKVRAQTGWKLELALDVLFGRSRQSYVCTLEVG